MISSVQIGIERPRGLDFQSILIFGPLGTIISVNLINMNSEQARSTCQVNKQYRAVIYRSEILLCSAMKIPNMNLEQA